MQAPDPSHRLKRCRRCHRTLKDAESIALGIGPVCRLKENAIQLELFGGMTMDEKAAEPTRKTDKEVLVDALDKFMMTTEDGPFPAMLEDMAQAILDAGFVRKVAHE